jgi:CO/xanthine dehydrogenase Mo-binding subunit
MLELCSFPYDPVKECELLQIDPRQVEVRESEEREEERRRLELGFLRAADTAMAEIKAQREQKVKWRRNTEKGLLRGFGGAK